MGRKEIGMSGIYVRECYKDGIVRPENRMFELHKLCDCEFCKHIYTFRKRRNAIAITAETEEEVDKAKAFLEKWKCADSSKDLPIVYMKASQL